MTTGPKTFIPMFWGNRSARPPARMFHSHATHTPQNMPGELFFAVEHAPLLLGKRFAARSQNSFRTFALFYTPLPATQAASKQTLSPCANCSVQVALCKLAGGFGREEPFAMLSASSLEDYGGGRADTVFA